MKNSRRASTALSTAELGNQFTRGAVAASLLTLVQERWTQGAPSGSVVARRAVQGGAALAAGAATANALRKQDYATALIALAGGVAVIAAAERLLNPAAQMPGDAIIEQENHHG